MGKWRIRLGWWVLSASILAACAVVLVVMFVPGITPSGYGTLWFIAFFSVVVGIPTGETLRGTEEDK